MYWLSWSLSDPSEMNSMDLTVIIDYRCRVDGNGAMLLLTHNAIRYDVTVRLTCDSL
jgi:hypothetical protein